MNARVFAVLCVGMLVGAAGMFSVMCEGPVRAECPGPPGVPCGNGDCNGDGQLDIADAIWLLSYLFAEGPEPAAIECVPYLPATGQMLCYDALGTTIDCDSEAFPGQDGFYQLGRPIGGRFVPNWDGTVSDTWTGLMWQQDTADVNGDEMISTLWGGGDRVTWGAALRYCDQLTWGMDPETEEPYDDWRLPNVRELRTLVDYGRLAPMIDPVFSAVPSTAYWSSTSSSGNPANVLDVRFDEGGSHSDGKSDANHQFVRAVRGP